ncbi:MAG: hypothetical protein HC815_27625 [Richelia sp. RM1_1_1]|nr:hypothetical protein [Richelia sp. RM1_1_1]
MVSLNATSDPELRMSLTRYFTKLIFCKFRLNTSINPAFCYAARINSSYQAISAFSARDWTIKLNISDLLSGGMDKQEQYALLR